MSETIISAVISAAVTLIGVILSHLSAIDKLSQKMEAQRIVMENELSAVKNDIKEHNHYAKLFSESMPVVQEQIKTINSRIDELKRDHFLGRE